MKIRDCDRQGCYTARGRLIRYECLMREYRCECGCSLIQKPVLDDFVVVSYAIHCPDCGEINAVIHYNTDFWNAMDADEVLDALPEEFKALIAPDEKPALDLESITDTLF